MKVYILVLLAVFYISCNQTINNDCVWGKWQEIKKTDSKIDITAKTNQKLTQFVKPNVYINSASLKYSFKIDHDTLLMAFKENIFEPAYYVYFCNKDSLVLVSWIWRDTTFYRRHPNQY